MQATSTILSRRRLQVNIAGHYLPESIDVYVLFVLRVAPDVPVQHRGKRGWGYGVGESFFSDELVERAGDYLARGRGVGLQSRKSVLWVLRIVLNGRERPAVGANDSSNGLCLSTAHAAPCLAHASSSEVIDTSVAVDYGVPRQVVPNAASEGP